MQDFATAIENFVFKAFNIWGRASRSEYWLVMPAIWALMLVMLVLDIRSFWGFLEARQVPPLNPLAYAFPLLFLLTLPSRTSLSIRRLHDSGRSGRWAFAPVKAGILAFWFVIGVGTAYLTSSNEIQTMALGVGLFGFAAIKSGFAGDQGLWFVLFDLAQTADVWTILGGMVDVVREMIGLVTSGGPSLGDIAGNLPENFASTKETFGAEGATKMLIMVLFMTFGPFIMMGLYLMFLLMPGNENPNKFGDPSTGTATAKRSSGKGSAMSGYAVLSAEGPKTMDPAAHREQVTSLYQSRVLAKKSERSEPDIYRAAR